jgi:FkbM family methyltransferase
MNPSEIDDLLAEGIESIEARGRALVDGLALADNGPFVLFGAGALGRWTLAKLRTSGVEPCGFVDNNQRLWGKDVDGLRVLSVADAVREFGRDVPFIVTVYNSTAVRRQLGDKGHRAFAFPVLALRFPKALLPHCCVDRPARMVGQTAAIREGLFVWADEASRREYVAQVRYRLTFDDVPPGIPASETYFPEELVVPSPEEVFVDCGAYDGDSVREFLRRRGETFGRVIALEPDPANIDRLQASLSGYPATVRSRVEAIAVAAGSQRGKMRFDATGTVTSAIGSAGTLEVDVAPLDDVLRGRSPSYIKMDIEGSEPEALAGAHRILQEDEPVLAICLYHRQEDLWQLPLQIRAINPRYDLFLRRYSDDCWEQICYAIPPARLRASIAVTA